MILLFLLIVFISLGGCEPISMIGAGGAVSSVAIQERGLEGFVSDTSIRSQINYLWLTHRSELLSQVGLSVQNGRVVLMGHVTSPDLKVEAVRLVWKVKGVREVIDELKTDESRESYLTDSWISTKLKTALLLDADISSRNYSVYTTDKVIYLMGIAYDQRELDLVLERASTIPNVRQVVNHVQLRPPSPETMAQDLGQEGSPSPSSPRPAEEENFLEEDYQPPVPVQKQ